MSVKANSHSCINMNKNMKYELWSLKKLYLVWMGLWDLTHALHKYALMVSLVCSFYDIMFYEFNMPMIYPFTLIFMMKLGTSWKLME